MITGQKPYPAYKQTNVLWLDRVPQHWALLRGKRLFRCIDNRSRAGDEELLTVSSERGVVPRVSAAVTMFKAESYVGYKLCWPGDLVINSLWAWGGGLGVSRHHGIVSSAYGVYRLRRPYDEHPRYVDRLVRSTPFNYELHLRSKGIWKSRLQLTDEAFLQATFPVPPVADQAAIVRFLDHADRRIRRYIRAKQQLIAVLEEQKQAVIHQAVTGQIDARTGRPYPAYKTSGTEWLATVPAHWEVMRVKQVSRILRGRFTHRPRNDPSLYDGRYPFIQTGEVARAEKGISGYRQTLNDRGLAVSRMFPAGTLVMTIAANIGDVAILDFEACFPDSVVGFTPRAGIERDFLCYVFRAMRPELLREAPVNTQGNLNVDRVGSQWIPIAPDDEQTLIVRQIEASTVGLNAAIRRFECAADLLREFRTRLIADVVTGKLDVREVAAGLPDVDSLAAHDPLDGGNATHDVSDAESEVATSGRDESENSCADERSGPDGHEVRA